MPGPESSIVTLEYKRGLRLARAGEFFEAHEAFELAWRGCDTGERDFFQGLVHVVVSAYQRGRGRPVAAERQRQKALRRLAAFAPEHRGLDVAALLDLLVHPSGSLVGCPVTGSLFVERTQGAPVAVATEATEDAATDDEAPPGTGQNLRMGVLDRAEPDPREQLVERDPEPPVPVEEEQQPESHERRA